MSAEAILKSSAQKDKEVLATQIAFGEIALNYHETGPFLQCKDRNGQIWRVGGVIIDENAPVAPGKAAWWYKPSLGRLSLYTAAGWKEISRAIITDSDIGLGADIAVSKLAHGLARQLLQTNSNGTDTEWTSNVDIPGTLDVTQAATFDSNVDIAGNLTVNGTTTTIDTTTLLVEDKNIEMGVVSTPTDVTADGGGITLKGTTDKTINWVDATDSWTSSEHVDLASGKSYRINGTEVLSGTTLGSGVTGSSLTSVGTISSGTWQGTAIDAAYLDSTVVTTGDTGTVTSTMIADGTIVDGDINASAAIAGTKISPDFGAQNVTTTGTSTAASFIPTSSTVPTNGVYLPAANSVGISTNGTGRLFVDSNGRVGVNTAGPGAQIDVRRGDAHNVGAFTQTNASFNCDVAFEHSSAPGTFIASRRSSGDFWLYQAGAYNIVFSTNSNERMRLDSSGRLGLGTSSPAEKLEIQNGSISVGSSSNTSATNILLAGYGYTLSGTKYGNTSIRSTYSNSNNSASLEFYVASGSTATAEAMRINSAGRVGVGTTSPSNTLHVAAAANHGITLERTGAVSPGSVVLNVTSFGAADIKADNAVGIQAGAHTTFSTNGANERARIDSSGRLGLGTSTPTVPLTVVAGSNNTDVAIFNGSTGTSRGLKISTGTNFNSDAVAILDAQEATYGSLMFRTRGTNALFIDPSQRVGVGTTSPQDTLQVNKNATNAANAGLTLKSADSNESFLSIGVSTSLGKACITSSENGTGTVLPIAFTVGSSSTNERMRITSDGKLGLGTSSPGALFHAVNTSAGAATLGALIQNASSTANTETRLGFLPNSTVVSDNRYAYIGAINVQGSTDNSLTFGTGAGAPATERMRIDSSGRVGVGTTSPTHPLHVVSSGSGTVALFGDSVANNTLAVTRLTTSPAYVALNAFSNLGTVAGGPSLALATTAADGTSGVERARIDSSGRLGLGTSSPGAQLHVATGNIAFGSTGSGFPYGAAQSVSVVPSEGLISFGTDGRDVAVTGQSGCYIWSGKGPAGQFPAGTLALQSRSSVGRPIVFITGATPTERVRIDEQGRVGVGTTSPGSLLDVGSGSATGVTQFTLKGGSTAGDYGIFSVQNGATPRGRIVADAAIDALRIDTAASASGKIQFYTGASYGHALTIDSSQRVGIGTTTPQAPLSISNGGANGIEIYSDYAGTGQSGITSYNRSASQRTDLYISTDETIFLTSGSERCRLDASGRLLVGTSSARSDFFTKAPDVQIERTADRARLMLCSDLNSTLASELILSKTRGTTAGSATVVQQNDELGILHFAGADGTNFALGASIKAEVDGTPGNDDMPGRLVFSTTADGASLPTERMRIKSNGGVVFTGTSGGNSKEITGDQSQLWSTRSSTADVTHVQFINPNGVVGSIRTNGSATSFNTSSDYRLKENVTEVTDGITRLQQLKPSRFNFIADPTKTVDGFIAHEVQAIVPEAITGEKDAVDDEGNPVYQGIDQSKLVPLLTAALQEAVAEINALKDRLTAAGI